MKRIGIALALLVLIAQTVIAQADMQLFIEENTITAVQAQKLSRMLSETLGEPFTPVLQEAGAADFGERMMDGSAPHLAIVRAEAVRPWALEGMLMPLDGIVENVGHIEQAIADACVTDERLYAAPLLARHHYMAVSADWMDEIRMAYLLDERSHPVWYPTELLQALDELALSGEAGMELWPPAAEGALGIEAILQGVSGLRLVDEETGACMADEDALKDALEWLEDMTRAGLIGAAESRQAALERFLEGETAIFVDWTPAETAVYAEKIKEENIVLLPYPSTTGMPIRAAEVICVCAVRGADSKENDLIRRAAALIASGAQTEMILPERAIRADGAQWLGVLGTLENGPTLRALFCEAVGHVLSGEEDARAAAGRIARALEVLEN